MPDAPLIAGAPAIGGTRVTGQLDPQRAARGLYPALAEALKQIGAKEVAEIREDLSVPVELGEDGKIIRSSPGEPPRKEFGILQENVEYAVVPGEGAIPLPELIISSSRPPISSGDDPEAPRVLELELHRPYMTPAMIRVKGYAADFIRKFFKNK
jgi:hypothetical protein